MVEEPCWEVFHYEYIQKSANENEDFILAFRKIEDVDLLIRKLLQIFKQIGFEGVELVNVFENHEIAIVAKFAHGEIRIVRDIYDFVTVESKGNKKDIDSLDHILSGSAYFKKI